MSSDAKRAFVASSMRIEPVVSSSLPASFSDWATSTPTTSTPRSFDVDGEGGAEDPRIDRRDAGDLGQLPLQRPRHRELAVGDDEIGHSRRRIGHEYGGIGEAAGEGLGGDERGNAESDAGGDEQRPQPTAAEIAVAKRSIELPHVGSDMVVRPAVTVIRLKRERQPGLIESRHCVSRSESRHAFAVSGMDPYLEDPSTWPNLHAGLIAIIQAALNASIRPKYVARIEERIYVSNEDDPGRR